MTKIIGIVQQPTPGVFALQPDDGSNPLALSGGDAGLFQTGAHVQVEGHLEGELTPIPGVGSIFLVKHYVIL